MLGKIDYLCERTHEVVPKYKNLTLEELEQEVSDVAKLAVFESWRSGVCEKLKAGDKRLHAGGVSQGSVVIEDESFEKWGRTGKAYTPQKFAEMVKHKPELKARSKVVQKRLRDGIIFNCVKVYNDAEDVMEFEEAEQAGVKKRQSIDDGTLVVCKDQLSDVYRDTATNVLGEAKKKAELTMRDIEVPAPAMMHASLTRAALQAHKVVAVGTGIAVEPAAVIEVEGYGDEDDQNSSGDGDEQSSSESDDGSQEAAPATRNISKGKGKTKTMTPKAKHKEAKSCSTPNATPSSRATEGGPSVLCGVKSHKP